jgi:hypothetical protein
MGLPASPARDQSEDEAEDSRLGLPPLAPGKIREKFHMDHYLGWLEITCKLL